MRLGQKDLLIDCQGFNPRICKRCDSCYWLGMLGKVVSIHASVKDATVGAIGTAIDGMVVSIHASVKDATRFIQIFPRFSIVSIHASVKDATVANMLVSFPK